MFSQKPETLSNLEKEARLRRQLFIAEQVAKLEAAKKTIDKAACREALLDSYARRGWFASEPECSSTPLDWYPNKAVRSEFAKRNPGYLVSKKFGDLPVRIFITSKKFQ